jgi:putative nucleotidyltransferase with HDIG domain
MFKDRNIDIQGNLRTYFKNKNIQRILIAILTIILAFLIVLNGATPRKYRLTEGEVSRHSIMAPRDVINTIKTEQKMEEAANAVIPEMEVASDASIEVYENLDSFIYLVEEARANVRKKAQELSAERNEETFNSLLAQEQEKIANKLNEDISNLKITLSFEQILYLISKAGDDDIKNFESVLRKQIREIMREDITTSNLAGRKDELQRKIQETALKQELKNTGYILYNHILKPNRIINQKATDDKKRIARNDEKNIERIKKDQRIISEGEIVTKDKLKVLEDLNLLETKSRFDYSFFAGILVILIMLSLMLILYMNNFCKKVFYNRNDLILLSIVILLTLLIARAIYEYSTLAIPIFIATMLISILLDLKLALIVNFILTIAIMLMSNTLVVGGDVKFVYMATVSGTFSAFVVSKANQRNKLSIAGLVIGGLNVLVIASFDLINKYSVEVLLKDSIIVFINGLASVVITIGLLPFLETTFNIITPMRLLELANPNQPLLKRLLTEAPGTYHHSLMVGNLAEAGTEAIGGNALLARVAAYFHDIGKLKRPGFFIENQLSENPHDKMTANLSSLVISSHIHDGEEMARKFKIPLAIRDIIIQHHGTTLIAYFYHKAKKSEKCEDVDEEKFRYDGLKPSSKEAAVVMLADSVEAAVRSMPDRTEGKIEGFIRKITKDKLDDGQFDQCSLTLKDLDSIAKAFMKVFSGYFHAREEYPEIKRVNDRTKENNTTESGGKSIDLENSSESKEGNTVDSSRQEK